MNRSLSNLHVLLTADTVGGVWVFATGLARTLCERGARVTLVTLGPPPRAAQIQELSAVQGLHLEVTDLALEWVDPVGEDWPRVSLTLAALDKRFRPDVMHLGGYREARIAWSAPVVVTAHSCVRTWWLACRGTEPDEPRWEPYSRAVKEGLEAADEWVAPTECFRDHFANLYHTRRAGRVVHNGIEPVTREEEKEPFVLAAGRLWDEAKNMALLDAIAGDIDWPVRIAGDTSFSDTAERICPRMEAEHIGALDRPHLLDQMRRASILAACPFYEPFGLTVLEAASSGCALVLSDIPTLRELWNGTALFADPREPSQFRDALQKLCRDDHLRRTMQSAARRRAEEYTLDQTADAYCEIYGELLGYGSTAPARSNQSGAALAS